MLHPWELSLEKKGKPLSVNAAYTMRRVKNAAYRSYEEEWEKILSDLSIEPTVERLRIEFEFGFSNRRADCDNPIKVLQDILQNHLGFNDCIVYELRAVKRVVPKGNEYAKVRLVEIFDERY